MQRTMRRLCLLLALLLLAGLSGCDFLSSSDEVSVGSWAPSGLDGRDVQVLKAGKGQLYAGTKSGLYRRPIRSDGRWSPAGLQDKRIVDLAWRGDGALLAGVEYTDGETGPVLYKRSPDSGSEWEPYDENYGTPSSQAVRALAAVPGARDTVYARGLRNVARSVDGGQTWTSVWGEWGQAAYQAPLLYVSPHDPGVVFAGGETNIFQPYLIRSSDHGATWNSSGDVSVGGDNAAYSMIEHPTTPGHFLLGMEGRILRSTDGGETWSSVYQPPAYTYVLDFVARQAGGRTAVYAAGSEDGTQAGPLTLHRTTNFGDQWERIRYRSGPDSSAVRSMTLVEEGQDRLYLGTIDGVYVYRPSKLGPEQKLISEEDLNSAVDHHHHHH